VLEKIADPLTIEIRELFEPIEDGAQFSEGLPPGCKPNKLD
tara:strand:- start:70 stop:192 length:123 start_codon:yes stop_codon:yes gene_type:complete